MTLLVLSVVGSDRPGLTSALSTAVLSAGGNWLESHLSRLGGLYVGSVLVEVEAAKTEILRSAVAAIDAQGLEVRIAPALDVPEADEAILAFTVVGQDRPGIVKEVTSALNPLNVNIEAFRTWITEEPHSGGTLFNMEARLQLPAGLTTAQVQDALEDISAEVMVDFH